MSKKKIRPKTAAQKAARTAKEGDAANEIYVLETPAPPDALDISRKDGGAETEKSWFRRNPLATGCILGAAAIIVAMAIGFALTHATIQDTADAISARQTATEIAHDELASTHVHNWQADTELIHHDAVTHEVLHAAVYEDVMVPHTVCNECHEVIDGATDEHYAKTGHESFTTNVPTPEKRLVSGEWTETVTDEPAYDELVTETETCASCGEVRPFEREAAVADE